jgi:DNA modification methylase
MIYNKDCMIDMVNYADNEFDLAIIDPPYGGNDAINLKNHKSTLCDRKQYD